MNTRYDQELLSQLCPARAYKDMAANCNEIDNVSMAPATSHGSLDQVESRLQVSCRTPVQCD